MREGREIEQEMRDGSERRQQERRAREESKRGERATIAREEKNKKHITINKYKLVGRSAGGGSCGDSGGSGSDVRDKRQGNMRGLSAIGRRVTATGNSNKGHQWTTGTGNSNR